MDPGSVQNIGNWQIMREDKTLISDKYNYGMPVHSTEVGLPFMPIRVSYDPDSQSAQVTFRISQNSSGNGTIDTSHILFRFSGIDSYGKSMDPAADEYSGFSRVV